MKINEVAALIRPNIARLCPYSTARDEMQGRPEIFLDANESPYQNGWNRYPDPHQKELKAILSDIRKVAPEKIFFGNGSDEAIDIVFRVFCTPGKDNIVAIAPSYGMYSVCAEINDIACRSVQLEEDFSLDTDKLLAACNADTKAIFLCSPNNPSGNAFPLTQIEEILDKSGVMVVVDEAYIDFCSQPSVISLIDRYANLIVLQTCSKARGMAALRLGIALSNEYVIKVMSMVKYPYNINLATQKLAMELLSQPIEAQVQEIVAERSRVSEALTAFDCVKHVYPSDANFILVKVDNADALYDFLIERKIIVRNRNKVQGCAGCLRVTIGLKEENDKLINAVSEYEKSAIRR